MLTRLPSGRRASTSGVDSSMRRPTCGDDAGRDVHHVRVVAERDVGQLELALALDVDLLRAVDHDVGDASRRASSGSSGPRPSMSSSSTRDEVALLRLVELDLLLEQDLRGDSRELAGELVALELRRDRCRSAP